MEATLTRSYKIGNHIIILIIKTKLKGAEDLLITKNSKHVRHCKCTYD
jgi:hypothetical protein